MAISAAAVRAARRSAVLAARRSAVLAASRFAARRCGVREEQSFSTGLSGVEYQKAISEMSHKIDKALIEQTSKIEEKLCSVRFELKREAYEAAHNHSLALVNVRNEMKALENSLSAHELKTKIAHGDFKITRLRNFGWFFAVGSAFVARAAFFGDTKNKDEQKSHTDGSNKDEK